MVDMEITSSKGDVGVAGFLDNMGGANLNIANLWGYAEDINSFENKLFTSSSKDVRILRLANRDKLPKVRKKFFDRLKNVLIFIWKNQQSGVVFKHMKRGSRITFVFKELFLFISSELRNKDLKPLLLLKVLYYFFLNKAILLEKNFSLNIKCTSSLRKFLTNPLKSKALRYLLKDIAVDILSELSCISLSDTVVKLFIRDFCYLQQTRDDLYGPTVAWLSNMTPETGSKLIHCMTEYSNILILKALNSPKMFCRLISVCESCRCCVPSQLRNVSSMVTNNLPSQLEEVSLMKTKSLYDLKSVNNMNTLIRQETIYNPIFHIKYEKRTSKLFQFSDLIFEKVKVNVFSNAVCESHDAFGEIESQNTSYRPRGIQKGANIPENYYVTEQFSSYIKDVSFWGYWDIFSSIEISIDYQLVFFGCISHLENMIYDTYSSEKANLCDVFTFPSHFDPLNIKRDENIFDPFTAKLTEKNIIFQPKKPSRKRKLSPSS